MNPTDLVVSLCETHHLINNEPAYPARFDKVQKFHSPGLAPVWVNGLAWHIRQDGMQAYSRRFNRVSGFYEGFAAVFTSTGAFHISENGTDAYSNRYDWCGNYQEGFCAVRESNGSYYHINAAGQAAYKERWKYAGDFRDSIAVVQANNGSSTHIHSNGLELHSHWFEDLDVYHKGFARAKDAQGWMHINGKGIPIYERRFASVEPFYNGQSRVETFFRGLEIIDESGRTLTILRPDQ
jgi:hypothetical protein